MYGSCSGPAGSRTPAESGYIHRGDRRGDRLDEPENAVQDLQHQQPSSGDPTPSHLIPPGRHAADGERWTPIPTGQHLGQAMSTGLSGARHEFVLATQHRCSARTSPVVGVRHENTNKIARFAFVVSGLAHSICGRLRALRSQKTGGGTSASSGPPRLRTAAGGRFVRRHRWARASPPSPQPDPRVAERATWSRRARGCEGRACDARRQSGPRGRDPHRAHGLDIRRPVIPGRELYRAGAGLWGASASQPTLVALSVGG
jgi:hypothetical protein